MCGPKQIGVGEYLGQECVPSQVGLEISTAPSVSSSKWFAGTQESLPGNGNRWDAIAGSLLSRRGTTVSVWYASLRRFWRENGYAGPQGYMGFVLNENRGDSGRIRRRILRRSTK